MTRPDPHPAESRARALARSAALASALLLAACAVSGHETRYTGLVTGCGPATHATLVAGRGRILFAPSDGAVTIPGTLQADGTFAGTTTLKAARPDGSGGESYVLKVEGQFAKDSATGTYTTPRCVAHFTLQQPD